MSQVWKLLKKNICFLIRLLINFYIFSIHHHVNFIVWISAITFIMFSLADADLNMLYYFLYPLLPQWQLIKFLLQLIFSMESLIMPRSNFSIELNPLLLISTSVETALSPNFDNIVWRVSNTPSNTFLCLSLIKRLKAERASRTSWTLNSLPFSIQVENKLS